MYDRTWLKHWDFIILDLGMLEIAYVIAYAVRMGAWNPFKDSLYMMTGIFICIADICIAFFIEPYHGIRRRGCFTELKLVFKHVLFLCAMTVLWLFLSQQAGALSRLFFLWYGIWAVMLVFAGRCVLKYYLCQCKRIFGNLSRVLVIASTDEAEPLIRNLRKYSFNEFEVIGIAVAGQAVQGEYALPGIPVVTSVENIPEYIRTRWIDSVFVGAKAQSNLPDGVIRKCIDMGITVYSCLEGRESWTGNQEINRVGGYRVLASSVRFISVRTLFFKRLIDIIGGAAGMCLTIVISVFLAPAIYIASPGPVIFSQMRVGKNGKKFRIYKFRSMYPDAEERKRELKCRNEIQGHMFKIKDDPRIIGSGADGKKKGIGWLIRKFSLDEFPQFWNVLIGDMSLVGTRPPTVDEWKQYDYYHRARLAVKPGLTGIWQVSGRSSITDFEKVVEMDMQYVKNWNIGMDMYILLKTVWIVLTGRGSE